MAVAELDFKPVAFAEIEDFPSRVLAYRFPDVPNLGDMTMMHTGNLGHVGWLVGGTPCQSFSVAGMRRGLDDDRGNLTLEYVKLAHRLADQNGLRGLLWENVPGCLSDKTNAFGCFLGALVGHDGPLVTPHGGRWPDLGMVAGPRARAAWRIFDSRYFGVPQRRRRVFVVADFGDGPDPAAVLFEPRGQGWGAEAGGEAGEGIAGTLGGSSQSGGFRTTDLDNNGAFVPVAPTLRAGGNKTGGHRPPGSDVDTAETLVAYSMQAGVTRQNPDSGPDGVGVQSDIAYTVEARSEVQMVASYLGNAEGGNPDAPSLNASNGKKGINNQTGLVAVFDPNQITSKANRSRPEDEVSHTMPSVASAPVLFSVTPSNSNKDYNAREKEYAQALSTDGGGPSARGGDMVVAAAIDLQNTAISGDMTGTLDTSRPGRGGGQALMTGMQVRRLTPTECERLQGFQDGWTLVPGLSGWRKVGDDEDIETLQAMGLTVKVNKKTGRARVNDPDGPRYKALGNSFTTEPVNWIMSRVQASLRGEPMPDWQPMQLWKRGRC